MRRTVTIPLAALSALFLAGSAPTQPGKAASGTPGLLVAELVGRDARVAVFATDAGTRFDIRALNGQTVAAGLTAEQVAALLPGQDPRGVLVQDDAPTSLMLANPARMPGE